MSKNLIAFTRTDLILLPITFNLWICIPNGLQTRGKRKSYFWHDWPGLQSGQPWIDLNAAVRSFLEIREGASTADIISLILFDTSARIVCKAMPLADLQPKLEAFLKMKGGGTMFGPALKEARNVIGDVHHQIGYPPLLIVMSDGGSYDGEPEMVSWTLFISYKFHCR